MAKAMKTKEKTSGKSLGQRVAPSKTRKLTTTVTFTASDLVALSDYIAAGLVVLRVRTADRAVSKLKAAMSRLGIAVQRGL